MTKNRMQPNLFELAGMQFSLVSTNFVNAQGMQHVRFKFTCDLLLRSKPDSDLKGLRTLVKFIWIVISFQIGSSEHN